MSVEATREVVEGLDEDLTWGIVKVLLRADDLIAGHGWIQRRYQTNKGFCAMGAVYAALSEVPMESRVLVGLNAIQALGLAVDPEVPEFNPEIPRSADRVVAIWNDMPERTAEDVRQMLQRSALLMQDTLR